MNDAPMGLEPAERLALFRDCAAQAGNALGLPEALDGA